jgi:hypothetical protein
MLKTKADILAVEVVLTESVFDTVTSTYVDPSEVTQDPEQFFPSVNETDFKDLAIA